MGSTDVSIHRLLKYIKFIQAGYKNITYHNKTHAADLCQTFNYFLVNGGLVNAAKMDKIEILSCLIAACIHDFEHPGVNNAFLVNMCDEKAIRHNDVSVLENHHVAASFDAMLTEDRNWACDFNNADFKKIRHMIIQTVLATDMTKHFKEVGHLKSRLNAKDFDITQGLDKESFINFLFHMADISNPCKNWELCKLWTELLFVEFFAQGDLEKQHNFPISLNCDRVTTSIGGSQLGFIDFVVKPAFQTIIKVLPKVEFIELRLDENKLKWKNSAA